MTSLFRPEVLERRQRDWLGNIQLTRPVSLTLLTLFVVVAVLVLALYLSLAQYTSKARISGVLVPDQGVIRLMTPQAAVVLESHVAEGLVVHKGAVLYVLAVGQVTLRGDTQAAVQASLVARADILQRTLQQHQALDRAQLQANARQLVDMRREVASLLLEVDLQRQRLALAEQAQVRLEALRADKFVSPAQVQTKAEDVLGLKVLLQALERQRGTQLREVAALEAQARELPLRAQTQRGEIDRDLALLAQQGAENEARQQLVVRAPQDGVVTGVLAATGQAVTPGVALASLLPSGARLQAHLFAPSSAVGFVGPGQRVQLRYQSFPYQKFGQQSGTVVQVSRAPLLAPELAGLALQATAAVAIAEPMYRITVLLDQQSVAAYGQAQPLAPGMQLEADVLLDRRRLIEWLFEPVLGIAGRV